MIFVVLPACFSVCLSSNVGVCEEERSWLPCVQWSGFLFPKFVARYSGCVMQLQASGYAEASVVECLMDFGRIPGPARNSLLFCLVCLTAA